MKTGPGWIITLIATLALLGAAMLLQGRMINRFRTEPDVYRAALYVPSEGYLKAASVGYDQFLADFFWLRMIQLFAAGWTRPENAEQMWSYYNGITDLDPKFAAVYSFAIMAVGESGHRDDMVQEIAKKSFRNLPGQWPIAKEAAFYAFWNMNNPELARFYVQVALQAPDCPKYLQGWVGYFSVKEGRFQAAFQKYMVDLVTDRLAGNHDYDTIHLTGLKRAIDQWYKSVIQGKAEEWQKAHGGELPTVDQLNKAGVFQGIEMPDWPRVRGFLNTIEDVQNAPRFSEDDIRKLTDQFLNKNWAQFPEGPYDADFPRFQGYAIWPYTEEKKPFGVITNHELIRRYQHMMAIFNFKLPQYKKEHNDACPTDPMDVVLDYRGFKDPLGGEFIVDPKTCEFGLTSVPDLKTIGIQAE